MIPRVSCRLLTLFIFVTLKTVGVSNRWTGFSTGTWDWNVGLDYLTRMWDWTAGLECATRIMSTEIRL